MKHFPLRHLQALILEHTRGPVPRDELEIKDSSYLSDNGVRGACLYGMKHFAVI